MTEQEAIEILTLSDNMQRRLPMLKDVYEVAVNALEEIQQYREIDKERGEVLKRLLNGEWVDTKDVEKYLNIDFSEGMKLFELNRTAEWNPPPLNGQKITTEFRLRNKELEEYQALGTVEELREAREKQVAKKINIVPSIEKEIKNGVYVLYKCPECGGFYYPSHNELLKTHKFRESCGQAIDCSDT